MLWFLKSQYLVEKVVIYEQDLKNKINCSKRFGIPNNFEIHNNHLKIGQETVKFS